MFHSRDENNNTGLEKIGSRDQLLIDKTKDFKALSNERRKELLPTIEAQCKQWLENVLHYKFRSGLTLWDIFREVVLCFYFK